VDEKASAKHEPSDATDDAPSKADPRLQPGGAHRAAVVDTGMSSLDPEQSIAGGRSTAQEDYGRTGEAAEPTERKG
jgi:hypothetical protein